MKRGAFLAVLLLAGVALAIGGSDPVETNSLAVSKQGSGAARRVLLQTDPLPSNVSSNGTCVGDCGERGWHWTMTDTIITIVVCLSFGMILKTVALVWYLKRRYTRQHNQGRPLIGGKAMSPSRSDPIKPEYTFDPKGGLYYPMAGTPSQTSTESVDNKSEGSSKPLQIIIDGGNGAKWQKGTIGELLKRNAERAASEVSSEDGYGLGSNTPDSVGLQKDRFRFEALNNGAGNLNVPLLFTFKDLQNATQNFSSSLLIGEGGFGKVYYGILDGKEVAVKRLEKTTALPGKHGEKQFRVEVDMMSRLKHPNLLEFIGYCADRGERVLVYPLMVNQSLFRRLHETAPGTTPLDCIRRITIAYQAARALAYLHDEASPQVIHRDFNSSNVLLDEHLDAVVSDFGLAKLVSEDSGQTQTTKLFGTMGYMAPEYLHGQVTDKNDVYSFGVVLLELISGRRAVISKDLDIVQWAVGYTKGTPVGPITRMADPKLQDQWPADALQWAVELAAACVEAEPRKRPKMADVALGLEAILQAIRQHQSPGVGSPSAALDAPPSVPVTEEVSNFTFPPNFSMTEFLGSLKKP